MVIVHGGWHSGLGIAAAAVAAPVLAALVPLGPARPAGPDPSAVLAPDPAAVAVPAPAPSASADARAAVASSPGGAVRAGAKNAEEPMAEADEPLPWAPAGLLPPVLRCRVRDGRRFCDGPRRVPRPYGAAAARAAKLGLGMWAAAAKLLRSAPRHHWQDALRAMGVPRAPRVLMWPVDGGVFGRGFGPTEPPHEESVHPGIDIDGQEGRPVRAVADGLVAYADNGIRGMGNLVIVLHGGTAAGIYAHLLEAHVVAGERVRRGDIVGRIGATGLAGGPHLHFEWHVDGAPADPAYLFAH